MYQSYSGWNMLNIFPYLKKMITFISIDIGVYVLVGRASAAWDGVVDV